MELGWLGLIIPLSYYLISLFFLCFPNILHSRKKYKYDTFNQLIDSDKIFCIGHRGGAFEGPQNTMQVFHKTAKHSHMFELDVCFTKDGQLVVHHDQNLLRTCGVNESIADLDYDKLPIFLQEIQLFGGEGQKIKTTKNKIPLLDDLFQQFPEMAMNIDLKTPSDASIQEFNRLVTKHHREDLTVWGAMGPLNTQLREQNQDVVNFYSAGETFKIFLLCITGLLPFVCIRQGVLDIPLVTDKFTKVVYGFTSGSCCKSCIACFVILILRFFNLISRLFIPHLKKRGILTFYFILNDQEDFQKAISMGCSGIMTDRIQLLHQYLKKRNLYFERMSDSF